MNLARLLAPGVRRAIGVMRMRDEKGQVDKIIGVHMDDPEYAAGRDISNLPPHRLRELQRFFLDNKVLEGEEVVVDARPVKSLIEAFRSRRSLFG